MPYVNDIAIVCMNERCRIYKLPSLRSFDPAVSLFGNRVYCSRCHMPTGIMVSDTHPFYQDLAFYNRYNLQDPHVDEGDGSGYNLLPYDLPAYPLARIPRFIANPRTAAHSTGEVPRPAELRAPAHFRPMNPADFFGMARPPAQIPAPAAAAAPVPAATFRPVQGVLDRALSQTEQEEQCMICLDSDDRPVNEKRITICDHVFHISCLQTWQNAPRSQARNCPNCRRNLVPN